MPKIIQIMPDHTAKMRQTGWLAVCDDGHVWRYHQVEKQNPILKFTPGQIVKGNAFIMHDPEYEWIWEPAEEFSRFFNPQGEPDNPARENKSGLGLAATSLLVAAMWGAVIR